MPRATVVTAQRDFSAGEIDPALKRADDHPVLKAGARQMGNWRILNSRAVKNRPGRRALFASFSRTEEVLMSPGNTFFLAFGTNSLAVFNSSGTSVFSTGGMPWTSATWKQIVWANYQLTIWIAFPGMVPQLLTWDGAATWTLTNFAEAVTSGNQKRTIFYRLSPKGVTMQPSATTGAGITMTFSSPIAVAGMVGTRFRFCGRQILCTAFTSSTVLVGTVEEPLPPAQGLNTASDPRSIFNLGDVVKGTVSNATGIVINVGAGSVNVQLLSTITSAIAQGTALRGGGAPDSTTTTPGFVTTDILVGPGGSIALTGIITITPLPVTVWDEEVMNSFRGYPGSVFFDQGRLGFCNFPAVPSGIAWSVFGVFNDFFVDAPPDAAMFEIAPDKTVIQHVVAGPESGEFVFGDRKLYYIPITATNPLQPGSVVFNVLDSDGAAQVQPRAVKEVVFYVAAGGRRVAAVIAPGAYYRPFNTEDVSKYQDHLFSNIVALATPSADGTFPERYVYALNANGVLAVGKYGIRSGIFETEQGRSPVGWVPWSGGATVVWVSALSADVIFSSVYAPGGIAPVSLVEILDDTRYLDLSQLYNTQPTGLPKPGGKGPLWYIAGGTVDLMDGPAGTRMMGTYQIDANGFLVPQNNAGEDFASANLVVGQAWTAPLEPFVPPVQPGQDMGQRLWPRRIMRVQAYVIDSTGFVMERLYSDQTGPNLPSPGTVMKQRRISTWNQDEDPTQPPTLREQSYLDRPLGRSHDPRWALVKDTPGPITVAEIAIKVST
jgi:hypothetical protein